MTHEQTLGELLAELDADADRRSEAEEWAAMQRFRADLDDLQERIGQELLTRDLLRKRASENFADELLTGRSTSELVDQSSDMSPQKRMTKDEADTIAQSNWNQLKWIDNQTRWAKIIGCGRKMPKKLPTWHKGVEWRSDRRTGVRKKFQHSISQELIAALSGDKSVLASLSAKEQEQYDEMSDVQRAELFNILNEDDEWMDCRTL